EGAGVDWAAATAAHASSGARTRIIFTRELLLGWVAIQHRDFDSVIKTTCYRIIAMKSYEVIRQAVEEPGVKAVAAALKVSAALVYKWCEPPADESDPDQSGAKNPLDRAREMYQIT